MRKAFLLLLFLVGGVAFALVVGSNAASASVLPPLVEQDQTGTNTNSTTQDSGAEATTHQANVNLPISVLSWGSNNGDVEQSNEADTKAVAANENETDQSVDQDQSADVAGSRGTSHDDKRDGAGVTQDQSGSNENSTEQGAESSAGTSQVNVNAPVSVLSWGSNNGDVDQSNDADTTAIAGNANDTDQSVDQDQQAASGGSKGSGGSIDQSQDAYNGNETTQDAGANASTKQANLNVPISVLSWGSNNGDVDQSNEADTKAYAVNVNDTDQSIDQDQNAWAAGSPKGRDHKGYGDKGDDRCGCDHKGYSDKGDDRCGCDHKGRSDKGGSGPSIDQDQSASNDNTTDQTANATATTEQKNVNAPLSFFSWGSNAGDVDQSNDAVTKAYAVNANETDQSVDQDQRASAATHSNRPHGGKHDGHGKGPKHPDPCTCEPPHPTHPSKGPHDCGCTRGDITQKQTGDNTNETTQRAYADAATKQKNVNTPFSFFSWDGGKRDCGCSKQGHGHGDDGVRQDNNATTKAFAANGNQTRQSIDQWQEALIGRR